MNFKKYAKECYWEIIDDEYEPIEDNLEPSDIKSELEFLIKKGLIKIDNNIIEKLSEKIFDKIISNDDGYGRFVYWKLRKMFKGKIIICEENGRTYLIAEGVKCY